VLCIDSNRYALAFDGQRVRSSGSLVIGARLDDHLRMGRHCKSIDGGEQRQGEPRGIAEGVSHGVARNLSTRRATMNPL
jgi:hypothetical protein